MKKRFNFILFLIYTSILQTSYCQEYNYVPFSSNLIWSEIYYPPFEYNENPKYERYFLSEEDTLINSLLYKKLFIFYDSIFRKSNAEYIGGIREDNFKRVYYKGYKIHNLKPSYIQIINNGGSEGEEILLYDFSLQLGDTFSNGNLSQPDEFLVVSDIDTLIINNTKRKIFQFEPIWWVKWIEGIGSIKGLLFTSGDLPTNGINNDLICNKLNEDILYFNSSYDSCIPLITGLSSINSTEVISFPNPCYHSTISFIFSEPIKYIEIFDCNGKLIKKENVNSFPMEKISLDGYSNGIYLYCATSKNEKKFRGKFLIIRN